MASMASCFSPLSILGGGRVSNSFLKTPKVSIQTKSNRNRDRNLSFRADYRQGGGADFLAGFLVGGTIFGTLAYVFTPQRTRQALNEKISQLNSAIDNVSSLLRDGNNSPKVPIKTDPEVEASIRIDYAIIGKVSPPKAQDLPLLLKQICQLKNDFRIQAAVMVLVISVKNTCKVGRFAKETEQIFSLANEMGSKFCTLGDVCAEPGCFSTYIATIMKSYGSDLSKRQFYMDMLTKCRKNFGGMLRA